MYQTQTQSDISHGQNTIHLNIKGEKNSIKLSKLYKLLLPSPLPNNCQKVKIYIINNKKKYYTILYSFQVHVLA